MTKVNARKSSLYFKARYYDPAVGRFLTEDSFAGHQDTPPSLDKYLYAYSNPEVYWDADGHEACAANAFAGNCDPHTGAINLKKDREAKEQQAAQANAKSATDAAKADLAKTGRREDAAYIVNCRGTDTCNQKADLVTTENAKEPAVGIATTGEPGVDQALMDRARLASAAQKTSQGVAVAGDLVTSLNGAKSAHDVYEILKSCHFSGCFEAAHEWAKENPKEAGAAAILLLVAKGKLVKTANEEGKVLGPVAELEVGSYKSLKSREVVGDALEHDHIPSFAALKAAKEAELGRELKGFEEKALYENATAVELPSDVHAAGRTWRGKNKAKQYNLDAADLGAAVRRDTEALRANLLNRGYAPQQVNKTINQIINRNREMGVIK